MICVTTKTDYTLSCDWHPLIQPPFHANASNTHTRLNIFQSIERYQLCVCDCLSSASQVFNSEKAVYVWLGFEIVLDCPASVIFGLSGQNLPHPVHKRLSILNYSLHCCQCKPQCILFHFISFYFDYAGSWGVSQAANIITETSEFRLPGHRKVSQIFLVLFWAHHKEYITVSDID